MTLTRRTVLATAASLSIPYIFTSARSVRAQSTTRKTFALHIGIDQVGPQYPAGVAKLNGCVKDAETYFAITGQQKFGKRSLLRNQQATVLEVRRWILGAAQRLVGGDVFLVTYAGHGGSLPDKNGDEPDGRDETWCLYDRQFRDDELYALWAQFDAGVKIVVISDSCHSGTVAREAVETENLAREIQDPESAASRAFAPVGAGDGARGVGSRSVGDLVALIGGQARSRGVEADQSVPQPRAITEEVAQQDYDSRPREYQTEPSSRVGETGREVPATGILLAGCQDAQLSWEQNGQGMFTNQLNKAFRAGTGLNNYSAFMAAIKQSMPANQTPNFFPFGTPGDEFYLKEPPFTV